MRHAKAHELQLLGPAQEFDELMSSIWKPDVNTVKAEEYLQIWGHFLAGECQVLANSIYTCQLSLCPYRYCNACVSKLWQVEEPRRPLKVKARKKRRTAVDVAHCF